MTTRTTFAIEGPTWDPGPRPEASAADATWGALTVRLGERLVWGRPAEGDATRGVHWTWVELLEGLAGVWPWLKLEEGWPAGLQCDGPASFEPERERALDDCPDPERQQLEQSVYEFRHRHDLATVLHGIFLPAFWVVREGRSAWVGSADVSARVAFAGVVTELGALGDRIATRLDGLADERATDAIESWRGRERPSSDDEDRRLVAIAVGLSESTLAKLDHDPPRKVFELEADSFEPTELLAAARMASPVLEPAALRTVLARMRRLRRIESPALDALRTQASADRSAWTAERAHEEGLLLALWLRKRLGASPADAVDPDHILEKSWGVKVVDFDLDGDEVDAVACWGPRHGPAILINRSGRHARDRLGRRATLAHEMAHLLADTDDALPLSEVKGGQAPRAAERRASAFAAEFLMPRSETAAFAEKEPATRVLQRLCRRYGASREIVAWQALNADHPLPRATRAFLYRTARRPAWSPGGP